MDSDNNEQVDMNDASVEHIASQVKGTVKYFQRAKGFGYLTRDDTKEDIYVHRTAIVQPFFQPTREKRRLNLVESEKVVFDVVKKGDRLSALNVAGQNGHCIVDLVAFNRGVPTRNSIIVNEARLTGKVKWFNTKSRFGYIQCDYNNEEVYVNSTSIVKNNMNRVRPSLAEQELVEFDLFKRPDGKLEAVNVTGPNGAEVIGSEYAPEKIDKSELEYVETGLTGKCQWFNLKSSFGYIRRDDNGEDVYVHSTSIDKKNPNHSINSLADGESVEFDLIQTAKGLEAVNVSGPGGAPVEGSKRIRVNPSDTNRRRQTRIIEPRNNVNRMRNMRQRPLQNAGPQRNQRPQVRDTRVENGGPRRNQRPQGRDTRIVNNPRRMPKSPARRNIYDDVNRYTNDEPLYYTFKPTQGMYMPNDMPRRISYDRYMDMMERRNPMENQRPMRNPRVNSYNDNVMVNQGIIMERVPGSVKWFNFMKGFGYITRYDNRQDIYVHRTGLGRVQTKGIAASLDENEEVEFDVAQDGPNVIAVNVTGPGGMNLRGSRYAKPVNVMTKVYRRKRDSSSRN